MQVNQERNIITPYILSMTVNGTGGPGDTIDVLDGQVLTFSVTFQGNWDSNWIIYAQDKDNNRLDFGVIWPSKQIQTVSASYTADIATGPYIFHVDEHWSMTPNVSMMVNVHTTI